MLILQKLARISKDLLFPLNGRRSVSLGEALLYHEIDDGKEDKGDDDPLDVVAVFKNLVVQLLFGDNGVKIPAQTGKDDVPATGTEGGVEQKMTIVHACQSGGDADEMAYAWNESAGDGGQLAVGVEVALALLHLFLIEQAEMAQTAVGKAVDDGAAHIVGHDVVDGGAEVGTERGKEDDEPHVEISACGMVGSR